MILFKDGIGKLKNLKKDEKDKIIKLLDELGLGYDVKKFNWNDYIRDNNIYCSLYNIKIFRR